MEEINKQKIAGLNRDFKKALDLFESRDCDIYYILGQTVFADWRLCAAYIDWLLTIDLKQKEFLFGSYKKVIIEVLEDFVGKWLKEETTENISTDIKNFDQLLSLLSLMRWEILKVDAEDFKMGAMGKLEREILARTSKEEL